MKRHGFAIGMIATMVMAASFPAFGADESTKRVKEYDGTVYVRYQNDQKYYDGYRWLWIDGYCYYFNTPTEFLKNTTTPDGYTVDEQGRWTVNGVVQHNGYGQQKVGTDEYIGKSDDEIWKLMKGKILDALSEATVGSLDGDTTTSWNYGYTEDRVYGETCVESEGYESYVIHNDAMMDTFVTLDLGYNWSDMGHGLDDFYYFDKPYVKERLIKAVIGDKIGQEFFDYIRPHADEKRKTGYTKTEYVDIYDYQGKYVGKQLQEPFAGDGMRADSIDLSAWASRTTDYGKEFSVIEYDGVYMILVYY